MNYNPYTTKAPIPYGTGAFLVRVKGLEPLRRKTPDSKSQLSLPKTA